MQNNISEHRCSIFFLFFFFLSINITSINFVRSNRRYHVHSLLLRDYYMTFSISALVLARDSHIKPDSKAGGLIWVEVDSRNDMENFMS